MENKAIAREFRLLAKLMEFQDENPFKIRSYTNAAGLISKLGDPLTEMSEKELKELKGVGMAISGKILELIATGKMATLERYKSQVPAGIQELLMIKGLGVRKIRTAWESLKVENATELLYACNENRLIELKGFGKKSQEEVRKQLEFFLANRGNFLFAHVRTVAQDLLGKIREALPGLRCEMTGMLRRQEPILDCLAYLIEQAETGFPFDKVEGLSNVEDKQDFLEGLYEGRLKVILFRTSGSDFERKWMETTGPDYIRNVAHDSPEVTEKDIFGTIGYPWIPPEARTSMLETGRDFPSDLVARSDIKGLVHVHTTFSDGLNTLKEMVDASKGRGFEYLVVTDHSEIAVYADGMTEEKARAQWSEMDDLNATDPGFKVIKGIECDIGSHGNLDYNDEFRAEFEVVISSIHTNFKMTKARATARLIQGIEHPHTNILGHPTGRLLLGRDGYDVDIEKVIDACAANQVAIEINANPYRLDLDWRHIGGAIERGVMIAINPDAHAVSAIDHVDFGVIIARKGWLPVGSCLNALGVEDFLKFCRK